MSHRRAGAIPDIRAKDLAGTGAPTLLVTQADADIFMTNDRKTVVYSWNVYPGGQTGVWAMLVP